MCLIVSSPRKLKVDKDGFCVGWKLLNLDNSAPYSWMHCGYVYKEGENISSRLLDTSNFMDTICSGTTRVRHGFHIYYSREDARLGINHYRYFCTHDNEAMLKIVKVHYKPEDVVAQGHQDGSKLRSMVVSKLTIKSLKNVR